MFGMTSAQATVGLMIKCETKRTRKNGEKAKRVATAAALMEVIF
jgi:hypothetical protein